MSGVDSPLVAGEMNLASGLLKINFYFNTASEWNIAMYRKHQMKMSISNLKGG